ncbi:hypothetical protein EIP91_006380 [Steccherinum ochraceum]|uniref:Uncharacterized protein n=1 Tax=Steccherinum ochraceum TaxID=92696 RepID=A0A4R0RKH0_9APHY|nr:hypothetical protein EIP91_006380 [Steccherinum ochraceum]
MAASGPAQSPPPFTSPIAAADNVVTAIKNISVNAFQLTAGLSSREGPGPAPGSIVDWQAAQEQWQDPVNAAIADFQALSQLTGRFVSAMKMATTPASETVAPAGTPLSFVQSLMNDIASLNLTSTASFASFLATTQAWATGYDTAVSAANAGGPDPTNEQLFIDAYPSLISAAQTALAFLQAYKNELVKQVVVVLVYIAQSPPVATSASSGPSAAPSSLSLPPVLQQFVNGNTDYATDEAIFSTLAATDSTTQHFP